MPGVSLITWAMDYRVDRARRDVTVTLFGLGKSHAVYREGFGCYLDHGDAVADFRRRRRDQSRRRCCLISPGPRSSHRQTRNWPRRSIAPLPSPNSLRCATRGRWWS